MARITHAIFDMGGTLVDMDLIADLLSDWAKSNGKHTTDDIKSYIREMDSLKDLFYKFFDSIHVYSDSVRNDCIKQLLRLILYKGLKLSAGADRLVKHLHYNDIPMAIVSSGYRREFDLFGQKFGTYFDKFFAHSVCGSDDPEVIFNKPKPDLYMVCAKRFPKPPKSMANVVVFEDSLSGISGAVGAGMQTVLINDRKYGDFQSISERITLIID
ncbi:unnamed protein product, partial [Oppiella nova]